MVNRSEGAASWGYLWLFVFFSYLIVSHNWAGLTWAIPVLFVLAALFGWLGDRQKRKDAAELEKAIRLGAEIAELAETSGSDGSSPGHSRE